MKTRKIICFTNYLLENEIPNNFIIIDIYFLRYDSLSDFISILNNNKNIILCCFFNTYFKMCYDWLIKKLKNKYGILLLNSSFNEMDKLLTFINNKNFTEVIITKKNTNLSLDKIFYNLHKYTRTFL